MGNRQVRENGPWGMFIWVNGLKGGGVPWVLLPPKGKESRGGKSPAPTLQPAKRLLRCRLTKSIVVVLPIISIRCMFRHLKHWMRYGFPKRCVILQCACAGTLMVAHAIANKRTSH